MANFLILNGPNLNLLGVREPGRYGSESLGDINARLEEVSASAGVQLLTFQSNSEHELIDHVHAAHAVSAGCRHDRDAVLGDEAERAGGDQ